MQFHVQVSTFRSIAIIFDLNALNFMSKYTASQQMPIILCSKLTDADTEIKSSAYIVFEPIGGLGATYAVRSYRLIGKLVMHFLIPIRLKLFSQVLRLRCTSEYWLEIGVFEGVGQFRSFSRSRGRPPRTVFARLQASECLTTLSPTVFTRRNFVADFLQVKCTFLRKTPI